MWWSGLSRSMLDRRTVLKWAAAAPVFGAIAADAIWQTAKGAVTKRPATSIRASACARSSMRAAPGPISAARWNCRKCARPSRKRPVILSISSSCSAPRASGWPSFPAPNPAWWPRARPEPWPPPPRAAWPAPILPKSGSCPTPPVSRTKSSCRAGAALSIARCGSPAPNWSSRARTSNWKALSARTPP